MTRRHRFWWRVLLAGPLVAATSFAVLCGSSLWLPRGTAEINHLILPLMLFPAVWAALFFHACLDNRLARAYAVNGVLLFFNSFLVVRHLV